jgi:hypothetical protein
VILLRFKWIGLSIGMLVTAVPTLLAAVTPEPWLHPYTGPTRGDVDVSVKLKLAW